MRPGRSAAIGIVAKGMDVHASLGVGIAAIDVPRDCRLCILGRLFKVDDAFDIRVASKHCNCQSQLDLQYIVERLYGPALTILKD